MFSRDDIGRGPRFPLLWVFGPFVLGALLVTGIGILARSTQGFPNIELADEIRMAATAGDPLLAETTSDLDWDRACVFPPSATKSDVDEVLGFSWGVIGGDPSGDGRTLVVLVRDNEVVTHFFLRAGLLDRAEGTGDCRAPDEESTRL
jgi:hypothetical protein